MLLPNKVSRLSIPGDSSSLFFIESPTRLGEFADPLIATLQSIPSSVLYGYINQSMSSISWCNFEHERKAMLTALNENFNNDVVSLAAAINDLITNKPKNNLAAIVHLRLFQELLVAYDDGQNHHLNLDVSDVVFDSLTTLLPDAYPECFSDGEDESEFDFSEGLRILIKENNTFLEKMTLNLKGALNLQATPHQIKLKPI